MEKNWNAMEKLWKSYGISFLGICSNPEFILMRRRRKKKKVMEVEKEWKKIMIILHVFFVNQTTIKLKLAIIMIV